MEVPARRLSDSQEVESLSGTEDIGRQLRAEKVWNSDDTARRSNVLMLASRFRFAEE